MNDIQITFFGNNYYLGNGTYNEKKANLKQKIVQNTKKISAQIIADSVNTQGDRITTYILTFPRFILAELNTHRMFSRNSASSRAIPFEKMVKAVEDDPFIPIAWQKDHKGMQGVEYITGAKEIEYRNNVWLNARDCSIRRAKNLNDKFSYPNNDFDSSYEYGGVTKQLCNRLIEPYMWHTVLVTATEWDNFFNLRCPKYHTPVSGDGFYFKSKKDCISNHSNTENISKLESMSELEWLQINYSQAEIHIQALAESMWDAMNESTPKELKAGEWHVPFGDNIDDMSLALITDSIKNVFQVQEGYARKYENTSKELDEVKIKIATARCARLSYMTHDGEIDYEKDIKLHDQLLESKHYSPFEHCARAMTVAEYATFIKGKLSMKELLIEVDKEHAGWCNNFKGFIPYRYIIENKYESNTNF